jgi:hypothetical protein
MPRPSTVRLEIDPSAMRRFWSSVYGTIVFANRIPKPFLDISSLTSNYDPSLQPATSYANLREHDRWRRGPAELDGTRNGYQDALESELRNWYSIENNLTTWHAPCRAISIEPLPQDVGNVKYGSVA